MEEHFCKKHEEMLIMRVVSLEVDHNKDDFGNYNEIIEVSVVMVSVVLVNVYLL